MSDAEVGGFDIDPGADTAEVDVDGDGNIDLIQVDLDGDGEIDQIHFDEDFDGSFDRIEHYEDGKMVGTEADTDSDGQIDTANADTDHDGVVDTFALDADGDGVYDEQWTGDGEGQGGVHGESEDEYYQAQAVSGECGPTSVAMILTEHTGEVVPYDEVVERAVELGLLEENADGTFSGMWAQGMEELMESYGVEVDVEYGDLPTLENYLEDGRDVIVAVDAGELWGTHDSDAADHYLVVTEIDEEAGIVTLNDPGQPDGASYEVPLDEFMDAWGDGGNEMIVTVDEGMEGSVPEPVDEPMDEPVDGPFGEDERVTAADILMEGTEGTEGGERVTAADILMEGSEGTEGGERVTAADILMEGTEGSAEVEGGTGADAGFALLHLVISV